MNNIRILVVEDDAFIAQEISDYLYELGYTVAALCRSYEQALKVLERDQPDLALLDIELASEKTGIDLALYIREQKWPIPLVFLSSQSDPRVIAAVKETRPDGFIVKPFDERDLQSNIEIALYRYATGITPFDEAQSQQESDFLLNNFFFVRNKNQLVKVDPSSIVWAEADDSYTHIHLDGGKHYLLGSTLKKLAEKLLDKCFLRIHRSYLINLNYLDKVEDQYVHLGKKALPIGRSYKQELMQRISLL